jgi:hypothetical protein
MRSAHKQTGRSVRQAAVRMLAYGVSCWNIHRIPVTPMA